VSIRDSRQLGVDTTGINESGFDVPLGGGVHKYVVRRSDNEGTRS